MQAIWISATGLKNYELAENRGIWGNNTRPDEPVTSGSRLYFAWGAGSPRVSVDEFSTRLPQNLVIAQATSDSFESQEPIWLDDSNKTYPFRFSFEVLEKFNEDNNQEEIRKFINPAAMRAFFMSANKQSTPQKINQSEELITETFVDSLKRHGEANRLAITTIRAEQGKLRQLLVGEGDVACDLCGSTFRSSLVVAAHIKPRNKCSDEELWDIPRVAMVACLFGCDASYERGYIAVNQGKLWISKVAQTSQDFMSKFERLEGRVVSRYEVSGGYFDWHFANRAIR